MFADFCGDPISSRRARFVASVLPSLGAAASGSGLATTVRLIKLSSRRSRVCKIVLQICSDPGPALLRVRLSDHQATLAAQRRSELRHHLLRDVDASAILFVSGFSSLSVRPPLLGSPSECIWPALRSWDRLSRVRLASSKGFRVFPTSYRGSSALLCFASECCGTTPLLQCCSRCVLPSSY